MNALIFFFLCSCDFRSQAQTVKRSAFASKAKESKNLEVFPLFFSLFSSVSFILLLLLGSIISSLMSVALLHVFVCLCVCARARARIVYTCIHECEHGSFVSFLVTCIRLCNLFLDTVVAFFPMQFASQQSLDQHTSNHYHCNQLFPLLVSYTLRFVFHILLLLLVVVPVLQQLLIVFWPSLAMLALLLLLSSLLSWSSSLSVSFHFLNLRLLRLICVPLLTIISVVFYSISVFRFFLIRMHSAPFSAFVIVRVSSFRPMEHIHTVCMHIIRVHTMPGESMQVYAFESLAQSNAETFQSIFDK